MVKVVSISGEKIGTTPLSASVIKDWIFEQQKWQQAPVINRDTGNEIGFTKRGVKDSLKRKSDLDRQAYAGVRELLEESLHIGFEEVRADLPSGHPA